MTKTLTIHINIARNGNDGFLLMLKITRHFFALHKIINQKFTNEEKKAPNLN